MILTKFTGNRVHRNTTNPFSGVRFVCGHSADLKKRKHHVSVFTVINQDRKLGNNSMFSIHEYNLNFNPKPVANPYPYLTTKSKGLD